MFAQENYQTCDVLDRGSIIWGYTLAQESSVMETSGNHALSFIVKLSIYLRIIYSRWKASGGFIRSLSL